RARAGRALPRGPLKPALDPDAPYSRERLVACFEPPIRLPVHSLGFGREAVIEPKRPLLAAALFQALPHAPADAAGSDRLALVLRLVFGAPAEAAAEARASVEDAACLVRDPWLLMGTSKQPTEVVVRSAWLDDDRFNRFAFNLQRSGIGEHERPKNSATI